MCCDMPCCSRKNDEGEQDELQKSSTCSAGRAAAGRGKIPGRADEAFGGENRGV